MTEPLVMACGKIVRGRITLDDTASQLLVPYRDNADLIAHVARLGYLDGTVLDATYGEGTFWKDFKPETLVTNDLYKPADHAWDFLDLPCRDGAYDSVVYDPDYKLNGTPALPEMDARYGTGEDGVNREARLDKMQVGAIECYRVARRFVLVKCMDMVEGGKVRWQSDLVTRAIEEVGGEKVARFMLHYVPMPQPPSWFARPLDPAVKPRTFRKGSAAADAQAWVTSVGGGEVGENRQRTAGNNYSTALVFKRRDYAPKRLL
jgi:hypothetical protein